MTLDTDDCLYVCTDGTNGTVHILAPKDGRFTSVEQLKLDEPDPYGPHGNDRAQYQLLREEMEETTFDL